MRLTQAQIVRRLYAGLKAAQLDDELMSRKELLDFAGIGEADRLTASVVLGELVDLGVVDKVGTSFALAEDDADAFCTAHYQLRLREWKVAQARNRTRPSPLEKLMETL